MTLLELYQSHKMNGVNSKNFHSVLDQAHWFTVNSVFDPKTGEALPQALSTFLARVARMESDLRLHDRLWRITEHARSSVERLIHTLNESPRREQTLLPVRAVRELDANSFIKLSNRPGRNIREKLAGKPYLQAVRRFQSVNLPENRLLKAFVTRLAELLELRRDCLGETEDELLPRIQSWLLSDEAQAIARWDNLPPNNTLLSHRDYRRVWDAWRWLQTLDEDINSDFSRLDEREKTMQFWHNSLQMWADGGNIFADIPVLFDYEKFEIRPWPSQLAVKESPPKIARKFRALSAEETLEPVCVDLTVMRPRFATATESLQALPNTYLWQQWKNDHESIDIELFNSDAAFLHPDATSISVGDLFFSNNNTSEHCDRAARVFASKLRDAFKDDTLIWLVPDYLNDFELEIIRRNLNARFPGAEPLPRSVAAVFQQVDYSKINRDGFTIVVVDTIGGRTCVTKLLARRDPELNKRLPETDGFCWERCPPVVIARKDFENVEENGYDLITVDDKGQWRDAARFAKPQFIEPSSLKADPRVGPFVFCINLTESPVVGGIRLHALQQRADDIPLWRDQIPELSIKVIKDGRYQRFHLVSRGTTVKPIRGLSVPIAVDENFTLPAGKPFYQFPLFQGENADELGFSARLDSPAFPLNGNVECKLDLTFEYGADEPYKLVFSPTDKSFPPVLATWRRTVENIVTNAPAPEYPEPLSWHVLHSWRDAQGNEVDLLEWLIDTFRRLLAIIPIRCAITISSAWKAMRNNSGDEYWFAFAHTEDGKECYCNTKQFSRPYNGNPNDVFPPGTQMFASLRTRQDGSVAAFEMSQEKVVEMSRETKQRIVSFRERSLQNRTGLIWANARSLTDPTCPPQFRAELSPVIGELLKQLPHEIVNRKMMCLLAYFHKDTTNECVKWITDQIESGDIRDPRAIGFALGAVSENWQQHIFDYLVSKPKMAINVFAYAIWREQHFVERFSILGLQAVLKALSRRLSRINSVTASELCDSATRSDWRRNTAETLELLLGLLRTRASSDPEIRMLLQPHQKITKELAKQVERVTEIVAQSNVPLFSRMQINLPQKPEGDRTPDLLYALRLYLTGDDGANAILIKSISDNDDD